MWTFKHLQERQLTESRVEIYCTAGPSHKTCPRQKNFNIHYHVQYIPCILFKNKFLYTATLVVPMPSVLNFWKALTQFDNQRMEHSSF